MTKKFPDTQGIALAYTEQARQRRLRRDPAFQARAVRQLRREMRAAIGRRIGDIAKEKLGKARAMRRRLKQICRRYNAGDIDLPEVVRQNTATWEEIVAAGPGIEEAVLALLNSERRGGR